MFHHLPNPEAGFRALVPLVRPGGAIFIWVYSESQPWTNAVLESVGRFTSRLPMGVTRALSLAGALVDRCGFILPYRIARVMFGRAADRIACDRVRPYARYPFQVVYADWFDWLSAPARHYYDGADLAGWAGRAGLVNVALSPTGHYGWRLYGELPAFSGERIGPDVRNRG